MKKLLIAVAVLVELALGQTPTPVKVCWTVEGETTSNCYTVEPGNVALLTFDWRNAHRAAVVQPLPAYQVVAAQRFVDGQTYRMQQADGSVVVKARYSSVQDLLMQHLVKRVLVPVLKLYPPGGVDAGQITFRAVALDLLQAQQNVVLIPQ